MIELRLYQRQAVEALREDLRRKLSRLLLVAPTGSGKTIIAAYIVASALLKHSRVLFIAHRRELITQAYAKLVEADIATTSLGIMMAQHKLTRPGAPVQIACIDTLRHRELPPADLVIVDEAHRSLSNSYLKVIDHYIAQGARVLGLTATPFRGNGGGLGDVYEKLVVVATPGELIRQGYIVEPRVFSSAAKDFERALRGVRVRGGDYVEADLAELMGQAVLVGNIVEDWHKHAFGLRTVAFSVNVAHSMLIRDRFLEAGVAAEHIDAHTPDSLRDAILERLRLGITLIVCNCGILCEGWDQPPVKCAILARPTKSPVLYLQQAGRILRPWEGLRPIILDHARNALTHGLPQDDRQYSLVPKKPSEVYMGAPVKVCPECHAMVDLACRKCPECGYVFKDQTPLPKENNEELIELAGL
jgi:superfamily II DNA or RNA helicase